MSRLGMRGLEGGGVEVGILGPLRLVSDDGRVLDVGGNRRRALLALLVLDANRAVAAELLVDRL